MPQPPSPTSPPPSPRPSPPSAPSHPLRGFALRVLLVAALVLGVFALALLLWNAIYVLILIFLGLLVAVFLRSLADWLSYWTGLGPNWSLTVVVLALVGISVAAGFLMAPALASQAEQLSDRVPESLDTLRSHIEKYPLGQRLLNDVSTDSLKPATSEVVRRASGWVSQTFTALAAVFIVFFVGLYLAATPAIYVGGIVRLLPRASRPRAGEVFYAIGYTLRWWLVGRVLSAVVVGIAVALGLWMLGIPLALVLGVLAAVLEFIPNIGPFIAAAPALLIALTIDPTKLAWVAGMYLLIQQVESYFLTPLVERKAVELPPALTITAQVLLGLLLGPAGLLIATPLMAVILVMVKMLYVEDVLGEELPTPDDQLRLDDDGVVKPEGESGGEPLPIREVKKQHDPDPRHDSAVVEAVEKSDGPEKKADDDEDAAPNDDDDQHGKAG